MGPELGDVRRAGGMIVNGVTNVAILEPNLTLSRSLARLTMPPCATNTTIVWQSRRWIAQELRGIVHVLRDRFFRRACFGNAT